jgi:polysaccharide pyruvyl transferase CsaB
MKNILLRGYYGYKNSGDDALFYTIVKKITEFSNVKFTILSKSSLYYPKDCTNLTFNNPSWRNILKGIFKSDLLIFGGGSQIQDHGKMRLQLSLLKTYIIVVLMKLLNKKVIFLGVSIGPLETKIGKKIGKLILSKADYIVIRDELSFEYLKKINFDNQKIKLIPDLAINLVESLNINKKKINNKKIILGINLMPFFSMVKNNREKEKKILETISSSINIIVKEHPDIEIRMFSFQEDEEVNDYYLLKIFQEMIERESSIIRYQSNPLILMEEISKCNRFIGMRLHSSIFAYACDVPQLILSYHPKCKGFAKSVGYSNENVIDLFNINPEEFLVKLRGLLKHPQKFKPLIPVDRTKNQINKLYEEITNKFLK